MARPVAKFTVAETSSRALSFFCTRAAHAAQVIPPIDRPTSRGAGAAPPLPAAADTTSCPPARNCPRFRNLYRTPDLAKDACAG